jgi:hypothetical protein
MTDYRVIFFNNLVNSYGKSFKCLQRVVTATQKKRQKKQKREFERLEDVPTWKYHAQFLEVERANAPRDNSLSPRRFPTPWSNISIQMGGATSLLVDQAAAIATR